MKNLRNSILFKTGTIIVILVLLLIPTSMIEDLIHERKSTQREAINEVSSKWGEQQTVTGPFISIPYFKTVRERAHRDSAEKITTVRQHIHLLPDRLEVNGTINPELRYRGIYEVVVYNSQLNIRGTFAALNRKDIDVPLSDVQFDKALLTIGIDDLRGIEDEVNVSWNGTQLSCNSGVPSTDLVRSGINVPVIVTPGDSMQSNFSLDLHLKGSQLLYFTPVGRVTDVHITSPWQNPSFNGAFIPDTRTVSDNGFTADWNVLHLNRNYPQIWTGSSYSIRESSFGIDLFSPVDNYLKAYRSIRYAMIFIGFTFLVFFFIEALHHLRIHPVQYILVGIALVVFYTLLLSISEHMNYNAAFAVAASANLLLIAGYVRSILKSNAMTLLISSVLTLLYTFVFVVIQLQDYALLIGSVGIFLILALVMYISRRIDWYRLNLSQGTEPDEV